MESIDEKYIGKLADKKRSPETDVSGNTKVLFTLHVNPEILWVNKKFNTEILRVKHCILTTLLCVSNSPD